MKRNDYRTVVDDLRAARAGLYRELAQNVGRPGERDLVSKVSDLLLAEEILLEQAGDQDGEETDESSPQPAEADGGDEPDYEAWERKGEWEYVGELRRLPRGGVLVDYRSGKETFVPEGVVRSEAMEHGDIVGALGKGANERGNPVFYFQVLDRRGRGDESGRLSFVAPLEFRGGEWGAWCGDEGIFVTVPDNDVSSLHLSEGDLVEVGYKSGEPASAKVAWKYDPNDTFVQLRTMRKEPRKARKEEAGTEPQVLAHKTVLVVGADAYKETFKRVFERRGARFTWESGFMVGKFLESKVRRADIVVIVTEAMKHKMPDVEAVCERNQKPYVYAPSRGASGALREVLELLGVGENSR